MIAERMAFVVFAAPTWVANRRASGAEGTCSLDGATFTHSADVPAVAVVERSTHDTIRGHVLTSQSEAGGPFAFVVRPSDGQLELRSLDAKKAAGKFSRIDIARGVVEFHTHPATCKGDTCTVPLPSAPDMVNILVGYRDGVQAHLLYCQDGVYVIQVSEALGRLAMATDPVGCCRLQQKLCEIHSRLDGLTNGYIRELSKAEGGAEVERAMYERHRVRWLQEARALGYDISDPLPLDQPPRVNIRMPSTSVCTMQPQHLPIVRIDTQWMNQARKSKECSNGSGLCKYLKEQL
jgi:hypothetical protein